MVTTALVRRQKCMSRILSQNTVQREQSTHPVTQVAHRMWCVICSSPSLSPRESQGRSNGGPVDWQSSRGTDMGRGRSQNPRPHADHRQGERSRSSCRCLLKNRNHTPAQSRDSNHELLTGISQKQPPTKPEEPFLHVGTTCTRTYTRTGLTTS